MITLSVLLLHEKDNVATAVRPIKSGETVSITWRGGTVNIVPRQAIPFGHKLAVFDIRRGECIVKYGEMVGRALADIEQGEHVHVHNVEGMRGRGDRQ